MKNYLKKFATLLTTLTLVVVLGVCLSACGNSNNGSKELSMEQYQANLVKAGYTDDDISVVTEGDRLNMEIPGTETKITTEWMINASRSVGEGESATYVHVTIVKCSNEADAKTVVDTYNKMLDEQFKNIPDNVTEEEIAEAKKGSVISRVGSVVLTCYQSEINAAQGK